MPVEIPAARTALKEDSLGPPPIIKVNTKLSFKNTNPTNKKEVKRKPDSPKATKYNCISKVNNTTY